jgi:hypothetical protein
VSKKKLTAAEREAVMQKALLKIAALAVCDGSVSEEAHEVAVEALQQVSPDVLKFLDSRS